MIASTELIERWSNAGRVLECMPEHDRQRHWNMATWGEITDCGTAACAAGHCGLDPWFIEHGFELTFQGSQAQVPDVREFFGLEGSQRIFYNAAPRPVETVLEEVRQFVAELQATAALTGARGLPEIGEEWPEQGGIFAGARLSRDGAPNYHLIVGPEHEGHVDWRFATAWTAALSIADHQDFVLPNRSEGLSLFDRVRCLFQPSAYWLGEQHAADSNYAWRQFFDNGNQYYWFKSIKLRARAVRRLIIC
jgi:hypothetical protein